MREGGRVWVRLKTRDNKAGKMKGRLGGRQAIKLEQKTQNKYNKPKNSNIWISCHGI